MSDHELYHAALEDFRENRLEEAVQKLNRHLEDHPSHEDAYEALSVILYNQKKYAEAITLIKVWIGRNPDSVMAQTNLSRCYVATDRILEAEQAQAEARRLTWKADLKDKKQSLPKVDHSEKIERYKQVIELDPADVLGYFSLGNAYLDAGKKREAVDVFEKAVEVDPSHSSSYFGFGLALESLGDKDKARRIYKKGTEVADKQGDVMTLKKMEARLRSLGGAR